MQNATCPAPMTNQLPRSNADKCSIRPAAMFVLLMTEVKKV